MARGKHMLEHQKLVREEDRKVIKSSIDKNQTQDFFIEKLLYRFFFLKIER